LAEVIADQHTHPARPAASSAVDPVCGMQVAVSAAAPFLDVAGQRVYFCSAGCRDAYAAQQATH
jgi:xanthine dehydrogenase accessory factor